MASNRLCSKVGGDDESTSIKFVFVRAYNHLRCSSTHLRAPPSFFPFCNEENPYLS